MADWQTFRVIHDFSAGSDIDRQETAAVGTIPRLPAPYYEGDSFRLELQCWQNKLASERIDFGASATAKLYITRYGVSQTPTELADGVLSEAEEGDGYNTLTFDVPADATDGYGGSDCLLFAVVQNADSGDGLKRTISQRLAVSSLTGSGALNPDADELPYTPAVPSDWATDPDTVAEALDELGAREAGSSGGVAATLAVAGTLAGKLYAQTAEGWVLFDSDIHYGKRMAYCGTAGTLTLFGEVGGMGGYTPGGPVFASATAGNHTQTAPTTGQTCVVGWAASTESLYIWPYAYTGGDEVSS